MALPPRLYRAKYHIADTILKRQIDADGMETFRGSGTDYSEQSDNILYVMSYPLERMVALKAFIESVTYNVAKSVDTKEEADKQDKVITFHEGDLGIDVMLNLPAHSVNEAVNNTAKLEELQRLIMPTSGYRANDFLNFTENMVAPMFFVWFKNIVSSGAYYTDYTKPQNMAVATMRPRMSIACAIEHECRRRGLLHGRMPTDSPHWPPQNSPRSTRSHHAGTSWPPSDILHRLIRHPRNRPLPGMY